MAAALLPDPLLDLVLASVRDWQQAGVWDLIHFALLDWLARQSKLIGREQWSIAVPSA